MKESPHILDQKHKSNGIAASVHVHESTKKKDDTSSVVSFFRKISHVTYHFKCAIIKQYARVTQVLIWFILWPLLNLFFKIEYEGRSNLRDIKPPLIIAANHQRFYDAFLLRIGLGFYSRLLPLRFMGTKHFSDPFLKLVKMTGIIHFLYATTGVFTVEKGLGLNKNLKRAKDILKNKGVVGIFPEGTMSKRGELLQFKRGVSALALSSNTKVLPVSIKITKEKKLRPLIHIKFLTPYKMHTGETYENLADELRDIIEDGLK